MSRAVPRFICSTLSAFEDAGHTVIPFSVRSPLNEDTPYSRYFPHGKSESGDAYFNNVKKTPKNVARLLSCAFYNREAYKNLRHLIQDERPDVVYVLQQINALSPSIFKACHDEGVRVVHRLSDFNIMCPRSDFLCNGRFVLLVSTVITPRLPICPAAMARGPQLQYASRR